VQLVEAEEARLEQNRSGATVESESRPH